MHHRINYVPIVLRAYFLEEISERKTEDKCVPHPPLPTLLNQSCAHEGDAHHRQRQGNASEGSEREGGREEHKIWIA